MIELPEALARAGELDKTIRGKVVDKVYPPSSTHKFCFFHGDASNYDSMMQGRTVTGAEGFGIFAEIKFDKGTRLCFNDGVNARIINPGQPAPQKYQLRVDFTDGCILAFTVAMYGCISCFRDMYDNEYYIKSRENISPLDPRFNMEYFEEMIHSVKPSMSAKAFLATEQRIPGLGNGVLQDILFNAGLHPKRKISTIEEKEKQRIFDSMKEVLAKMVRLGGRDTEKDIWGNPGGYRTILSKKTYKHGCPDCGGEIVKTSYLGGSVYYCPFCQKLG